MPTIRIDLVHVVRDSLHMSKLIWQQLFNLYREGGGKLNGMYDLLCDLEDLEQFTKQSISFYWGFYERQTELSEFNDSRFRGLESYHIHQEENEIIIEPIEKQV